MIETINFQEPTKVKVTDSTKGIYERANTPNLVNIIKMENEIELIKEQLKNINFSNLSSSLILLKRLIIIFGVYSLLALIIPSFIPSIISEYYLISLFTSLILTFGYSLTYRLVQKKLTQLKLSQSFLKNELQTALIIKNNYEKSCAANLTLNNSISLKNDIAEKRKLLNQKLAIINLYCQNQKKYDQAYYNGTFDQKVPNAMTNNLIRELITQRHK